VSDNPPSWNDSLDSLAALVERQRRYVAGEAGAPVDEWDPPRSSLPAELRPRAMVLLDETVMLSAQIQRRLAAAPDARVSPYA
jgi:hypothetical protein